MRRLIFPDSGGRIGAVICVVIAALFAGNSYLHAGEDVRLTIAATAAGTGPDTAKSSLLDAIVDAETASQNAGNPDNSVVVEIKIDNNQTTLPGPIGNKYFGAWLLHGTDDVTTIGTGTPTYKGYLNVTLDGATAPGGKAVINAGNADTNVLGILHVSGIIDVKNLKVTGGNLAVTAAGVSPIAELAGGGMILGANGLGGTHEAPTAINLTNIDAEYNKITLGAANTNVLNAYGAGIAITGVNDNPATTQSNTIVTFNTVNLKNNTLDIDGAAKPVSIRGGGARLGYIKQLIYTGGTIESNTVTLTTTYIAGSEAYASGGGLSVDGNSMDGETKISNVSFKNNTVTMNGSSASSVARGGGLFFNNQDGTTGTYSATLKLDGTTSFEGNKAIATGASIAGGGAATLMLNTGDATISGVTFTNNSAEADGGFATGGGIHVTQYGSAVHTNGVNITGGNFTGNFARSAASTAAGGALLADDITGAQSFSGVTFSNNYASGATGAFGGALRLNTAAHIFGSGNTFTGNYATATTSGNAQGGAIYFSGGNQNIGNANFTGNYASAATGAAQGGAIYQAAGALDITNGSFIDNYVTGTGSQGGAIYMNGASTLNLNANGGMVEFSGNKANGVANSIHFGGAGAGTLNINTDATGKVHLLDPITADATNFALTATGAGEFVWGGNNFLDANSTININGGDFYMANDFQLGVTAGKNLSVSFNNVNTIVFDVGNNRPADQAFIDFTNATLKTLTVGGGPNRLIATSSAVGTAGSRPVHGFDIDNYRLIRGIDPTQGNSFISGVDWQNTSNNQWTYINDLRWENNDPATTNIVANAGYYSPFENSGTNAYDAHDAFDDLVNRSGLTVSDISDAEWRDMQNNAAAITPEIFMQASNAMIDGVARFAASAIDYGVRNPHRTRMRMEDSYTNRRTYRGRYRQAPVPQQSGGTVIYQQQPTEGIENYQAYPRLEDCYYPGYGFRVWAGYVGEWRSQRDRSGYKGYDVDRNGVLLGFNYDFGTIASIGIYGGYSNADIDARDYDAEVDSDNGHFGLVGRVSPLATMPELSFFGDFGYHFANNDSYRRMGAYSANGSFDQDAWTFGLGAEYVIRAGMFNITPQADLRYTHLSQDGLNENGNSSTLTRASGLTSNQFTHRLGVEFSYDFLFGGGVVTPALSLGWKHDWGTRKHDSTAYYINDVSPLPFNVSATPNSRDSVDIGVALKSLYSITSSTKLGVNVAYNLNLGSRSDTHMLYAGVELGF